MKKEKLALDNKDIIQQVENFMDKIKLDPEFTMSWLSALTKLEQHIVSIIYNQKEALSIKQIRNNLVDETQYAVYINKIADDKTEELKRTNEQFLESNYDIEAHLKVSFPFQTFLFLGDKTDRVIKQIDGKTSTQDFEKILLKEKIALPSFRTIDERVKNLVYIGILRERKDLSKKVKALYYLDPVIRTQLNKIREQKKKEFDDDRQKEINKRDEQELKKNEFKLKKEELFNQAYKEFLKTGVDATTYTPDWFRRFYKEKQGY
ncbi:MAG: hypothetical protein WC979_05420 [Candidatus Pacearchaeota archaeon]|jgi:hypothetical protein